MNGAAPWAGQRPPPRPYHGAKPPAPAAPLRGAVRGEALAPASGVSAELEALHSETVASLAAARSTVHRLASDKARLEATVAEQGAALAALAGDHEETSAAAGAHRDDAARCRAELFQLRREARQMRCARAKDRQTLEAWAKERAGSEEREREVAAERQREKTRDRAALRSRLDRVERERDAARGDLDAALAAAQHANEEWKKALDQKDRVARLEKAKLRAGLDQGRKRGIQRRFNVGVSQAISERKASTLRVRPER